MVNYSITLQSTSVGRDAVKAGNYKCIVAKGVKGPGPSLYTAAWHVFKLDADVITLNWKVDYKGGWTNVVSQDKMKITSASKALCDMAPGNEYIVTDTGNLILDPNAPPVVDGDSAFHFANPKGAADIYDGKYVPLLLTNAPNSAPNATPVPFWTASTGVLKDGNISATPIEVVRVWLGNQEAGTAVVADYGSAVVEFNLTNKNSGTALLLDDLSGWTPIDGVVTNNPNPI